MKKTLVTGIITGAAMLVLGLAIGQIFAKFAPSLKAEYENPNLFRPWTDPLMSLYFVQPFVMGILLAWVWNMTKGVIKGDNLLQKGFYFGLVYWTLSFPGMIMSYSSFPLSLIIVISWSVTGLFQSICAGVLFSKMLK